MAKLTKAQTEVVDEAKRKIDEAREAKSFEDYKIKSFEKNTSSLKDENYRKYVLNIYLSQLKRGEYEWERKYYEKYKTGLVLVTANTKTLKKLEELGIIELVSVGNSYPDWIKLLNY